MACSGEHATGRAASHRWKVLGVGVAANASFAAAFSGIPATAVWLRHAYAISTGELGVVLGMLGLGIVLSELPWGLLTDRWGDRRVLLLGLASTMAALVAMAAWGAPSRGHVPSPQALAAGFLAIGLLGGSVNGSSGRAVMAWSGPGERGLAMSIRQTAVPSGAAIGALLLPALAAHAGFAWVYGALAAMCLLSAILTILWVREPDVLPHEATATGTIAAVVTARSPLMRAQVWRMVGGIAALCIPQVAVITFASVFLHDFGHAGAAVAGGALASVQLGAAVMRVWSGRWTDRRANRNEYLRACAALTVALFALLAAATAWCAHTVHGAPGMPLFGTIGLLILLVAGGIAASAWHGVAFTELATLAGHGRVGSALAMGNTGAFIAFWLAPSVIPMLLAGTGWPSVWLAAAACGALAWPAFARAPANRLQMDGAIDVVARPAGRKTGKRAVV
ncbi:MFS family permease [Paraburkholderia bannensis]|uniref:MFS family permease n=1 Tax=Paraburkholderia bannensis TaxID=765414 RepID=A0A7W9WRB5_9BURK|nr:MULTISPECIES: MFS transporter [Paraburkholderia]MBB3256309.1 MFS family permease [Paraburkholderia sp. WP4_3_2]MBB6101309.1 MFS family permease [Paraburkholderia bannensis]